jgi:hypothetical protein
MAQFELVVAIIIACCIRLIDLALGNYNLYPTNFERMR